MGQIVQAAKITHVPSIWMSHTMEQYKGIRQPAIDGYAKLRQDAIDREVETFIIFDTHWITNQGFHLNAKPHHKGRFISHELPHMLADMEFDYRGDSKLAQCILDALEDRGERAMGHAQPDLGMEYGTLLPMHFINDGVNARVLPVAVNQFSSIEENRRWGAAIAEGIKRSNRKVSVLASGSMSHDFTPNERSVDGLNSVNGEFNRQMDLRVLELWKQGKWAEFLDLLPDYAVKCTGECAMNDTALLFGALGWKDYDGSIDIYTPYFGSSGTGQANISFSV
ncbi:3,4-dihydroxyphenylacetate 2,3-dioxygenase [Aliiroseovarius sp. F20344]|uniref:3,4-dihydroxyphenylacetate 2,3-dioxygenase n=1 Tax=Aliiroseovarius sp. F20344 TaxID=2926414 RepID=UPI001FF33C23|nr:3,4-dihydroxyphenylacetate 2,3-dioxygenase [Aliiroseovarius sp. F20344]MCK0142077.1 3,4-dihydroxyphenylacetate 2,3-dioxygenase [Aliiroseovarius sp. F20344]